MKITAVDIYAFRSGGLTPVILRMETDAGISGLGEATVSYGIGSMAAAAMIKELAERLILGKDPSRIEALWSEMYDHAFWTKGGGAIVFSGLSAIEQALWDIKGKALGVPVYELLGGAAHDRLRAYANGWCMGTRTVDEFVKAAERPLADGYTAIKCYPLATSDEQRRRRHVARRMIDRDWFDSSVAKVRALRAMTGPGVEIMLDLSGALTTDETLRFLRRVEECDILFAEEPADPFDLGALEKISRSTSIPLAAGERLYTRHGFRRVIEGHLVDVVQPDVGTSGGIMELKKIAAFAEAYNMRFAPHNCASALATTASLQVAACTANFMIQEIRPYEKEAPGYVEVLENNPEYGIRDGWFPMPEGPGLGAVFAEERMKDKLWARCTLE